MPVWCEADDFTRYLHTGNISRDGLFVRTFHPLPENTPFTVVIGKIGVAIEVRVSWVRDGAGSRRCGMGLEITGFERGEHDYKRFLAEHFTHGSEAMASPLAER